MSRSLKRLPEACLRPSLPEAGSAGPLSGAVRSQVLWLGGGYLLALALVEGLIVPSAPWLGPPFYGLLLMLFLSHALLIRRDPSVRVPLLLSLAPAGNLLLVDPGPLGLPSRYRYLALGVPIVAGLVQAFSIAGFSPRPGLLRALWAWLARTTVACPSDVRRVRHLLPGYLVALVVVEVLSFWAGAPWGGVLYGLLLLLFLLHAALSWERRFRYLPLVGALAPAGRMLLGMGPAAPALPLRLLVLGVPLAGGVVLALPLAGWGPSVRRIARRWWARWESRAPASPQELRWARHLLPGYVLALVGVEVLLALDVTGLAPLLYGLLLSLFLLHAALSWERPFHYLPLTLSLAPAGRLVLVLPGAAGLPALCGHLVLGLPLLGALVQALALVGVSWPTASLRWARLRGWGHAVQGWPGWALGWAALRRGLVGLGWVVDRLGGLWKSLPASRAWGVVRQALSPLGAGLGVARARVGAALAPGGRFRKLGDTVRDSLLGARLTMPRPFRRYLLPVQVVLLLGVLLFGFLNAPLGAAQPAGRVRGQWPPLALESGVPAACLVERGSDPREGPLAAPRARFSGLDRPVGPRHAEADGHRADRGRAGNGRVGGERVYGSSPEVVSAASWQRRAMAEVGLHSPRPDVIGGPLFTHRPREVGPAGLGGGGWGQVAMGDTAPSKSTPTAEGGTVTASAPVGDNAYNPYARGQCTWYAKERRPDLPWFSGGGGNALNWARSARQAGFRVDGTPAEGAVLVLQPGGYGGDCVYGHVAYVEAVADGTMLISECNVIYEALLPDRPIWWEAGHACGYRYIPLDQLDADALFIHGRE